jgi:hypothetical protein
MSDLTDFLNNLPENKPKKTKVKREPLAPEYKARYLAAHKAWFAQQYPSAFKDGHYVGLKVEIPNDATANGLTAFIENYLKFTGCYSNRINVQGRVIQTKDVKTPLGVIKGKSVQIKSSTKKGSEDIDTIINGYSVKIEIKVGKDTHKTHQIAHGEKVKKAGGSYFVVRDVATFFSIYDKIMSLPFNGVPVGLFG